MLHGKVKNSTLKESDRSMAPLYSRHVKFFASQPDIMPKTIPFLYPLGNSFLGRLHV